MTEQPEETALDVRRELELAKADVMELVTPTQRKFLIAYANCGTIAGAARLCGFSVSFHYHWLEQVGPAYELYRKAFALSFELHIQSLEGEVFKRAKAGVKDPASASLLMFALKSKRPSVYRETQQVNIQNNLNMTGDIELARQRAVSMRVEYTLPAPSSVVNEQPAPSQVPDGTQAAQGNGQGQGANGQQGGA